MRKEWLIAAIITFVTICAWVAFDIIHSRPQPETPQQMQELIEPISPEFNTDGFQPTQ